MKDEEHYDDDDSDYDILYAGVLVSHLVIKTSYNWDYYDYYDGSCRTVPVLFLFTSLQED